MITPQQIQLMRAQLKSRADRWSPNGLVFLIKRSNTQSRADRALVEQLLGQYMKGDFDKASPELVQAVAPAFALSSLGPEVILIILLGRAPLWRGGLIEEQRQILRAPQAEAQALLARSVAGGMRYLNRPPKSGPRRANGAGGKVL